MAKPWLLVLLPMRINVTNGCVGPRPFVEDEASLALGASRTFALGFTTPPGTRLLTLAWNDAESTAAIPA